MKLYPCVLLGDFGTAKLADTLTTAQAGRWSTTDADYFNIDLTRAQANWDRKSLRIATGTSTASNDQADYGVVDTDVGDTDIINGFGNDVNDLTWCTDLGCWLYHTDNVYSGGDADQFMFYITNGGTDIEVYWPSTFNTTDQWMWIHDTPDAGTFASDGDNVEQWGFKATAAFTASSYFYINTFVAYRTVLSSASNDYTATNGLHVVDSSVIPTGWNVWNVSGKLVGDYVVEQARQLHEMETIGLSTINIVKRPTPKYQALKDCDNIKTYLMYLEGPLGAGTSNKISVATPVIITNVSTEIVAPPKKSMDFSFTAMRFSGV